MKRIHALLYVWEWIASKIGGEACGTHTCRCIGAFQARKDAPKGAYTLNDVALAISPFNARLKILKGIMASTALCTPCRAQSCVTSFQKPSSQVDPCRDMCEQT